MKNVKCIILFSILCLLILVPATFAADNETAIVLDGTVQNDDVIAVNGSVDEMLGEDYYFDANIDNVTQDGSEEHPYKNLSYQHIRDNSVIHLANGEYDLDRYVTVHNVTILGQDCNETIIRYDGVGFYVYDNFVLQNVTLIDCAISVNENSHVNVTNVAFRQSQTSAGGSIYIKSAADVNLDNCTFIDSLATEGGAIYANGGTLSISDCQFINSSATNFGGAIVSTNGNRLIIKKSRFINSTAGGDAGGAIYIFKSSLNASDVEIINSSATFGAAITALQSNLTINNLISISNRAIFNGGAIYEMYGIANIANSTFFYNSAKNGAALFLTNLDYASLANITVSDNVASNTAAVYVIMDYIDLFNITFMNNQASYYNDYLHAVMPNLTIGNGDYTLIRYTPSFNGTLPASYDLRLLNQVTPVKNQGNGGNCWAFSVIASLESCILKATGQEFDLSEENVKNLMARYSDYGWQMDTNNGGYDKMGRGYLVSWLGPINDIDDVYNGQSLMSGVLNSIVHVQNIMYLQRGSYTDNDEIKRAIMEYGGVSTSIYWSGSYTKGKNYYYNGDTSANHAVTIVGWDDNYSKTNFRNTPQGDGAWIIKNSWGTGSGENGFYYVSYYDTRCAPLNRPDVTFTFILNDTVKFDKNYQYDIPGLTDYFLNSSSTVWYKNRFTATDDEFLAAVSTYFEKNTVWDLYVYVNDVLRHTQNGSSGPGYFTINLNDFIDLGMGDVFEVAFKISVDGEAAFPISEAVSLNHKMYGENISFLSYDGENWVDMDNLTWKYSTHTYASQVACIKAFTILDPLATSISLECTDYNPAVITARVFNQYGSIVKFGNVAFNVEGVNIYVEIIDGVASLNHTFASLGDKQISAYFSKNGYITSNATINTSITREKVEISLDIVKDILDVLINVDLSSSINDTVYININNSTIYPVSVIDGHGSLPLSDLYYGSYSVFAYANSTGYHWVNATDLFTIDWMNTFIQADSIDTYYNSTIRYSIRLVDKFNQTIPDKNIVFSVNGINSTVRTDENGIAYIDLNLNPGTTTINIISNKEGKYLKSNETRTVRVLSTVILSSNIKFTYNAKYEATLLDYMGNPLSGVGFSIVIGDETYAVKSDANGKISVTLKLSPATFTVRITNPDTSETKLQDIKVVKRITLNKNVAVYYGATAVYKVKVFDDYGNIAKGVKVTFKINGKEYTRTSDSNGYASFNINLAPKAYTVYAIYKGFKVTNTVTIKPTIVAKDTSIKGGTFIKFYAKLLDSNGKIVKNKIITFKFKGATYNIKTNDKGIACLKLVNNLKKGKYTVVSTYGKLSIKNIITIS